LRSLNDHSVEYVLIGGTAYDLSEVTDDELLTKKVLIRQYLVEADIHPYVRGVTIDVVWSRRVHDRLGQTPTAFASLDDLVRMKEAAGRPKDLEDLRVLRRLRGDST
jgi:predicted nucleotidyltransferase